MDEVREKELTIKMMQIIAITNMYFCKHWFIQRIRTTKEQIKNMKQTMYATENE